ncbi:hypothetical protein [Flagellimonas oceanensis]|uniref:hypothetical protein n=1 Tax=Flagellimonas oceanensis TaxID=2499163 RepID=UPI000F8CFC9A|nr:hypothetical protein [Allomuricauda oceanensis]|tara:strand:+ start:2262 stop:2726 length:465 start_codon:yes stop_codon:yes gene_type:complete
MKKLLLTSVLLATVFVVLGSMDAFQRIEGINVAETNSNAGFTPVHSIKYNDCIGEDDFPEGYLIFTHEITNQHTDWDIIKVNESVQKYAKSLDSTLKNLNTVDAHEFIHQAFQISKDAVDTEHISDIQKHYHGEIMRMCLARDKQLNKNKAGIL